MTDEIIKALEHCGDENNCTKCPYRDKRFEPDISCAEELMRIAAEQMKRLKAENERLNIRNKTLSAITINYDWKFEKVKTEAIKEFAERLKKKFINNTSCGAYVRRIIDELVKELTHHKETVSMIDGHIEE